MHHIDSFLDKCTSRNSKLYTSTDILVKKSLKKWDILYKGTWQSLIVIQNHLSWTENEGCKKVLREKNRNSCKPLICIFHDVKRLQYNRLSGYDRRIQEEPSMELEVRASYTIEPMTEQKRHLV